VKNLFVILFFSSNIFAQSDSIVFTASDIGVKIYQTESALDTNKTWTVINNIQPKGLPDSSKYGSPISVANIFYRAAATMINGYVYYTPAIYYGLNSVTITNVKKSTSWWTDKLYWTTSNEVNVNYYLIEYASWSSWIKLVAVAAKGSSNYSYTNSRGWFSKKTSYRLTVFYKDNTQGQIVYF